jgi:hypothetical protein
MLQQTRGDKQELSVMMYKKDVKTKRGVVQYMPSMPMLRNA